MAVAPTLSLTPAYPWLGQVLFADQTEEKIYRLIDLNGDGDAVDAGEHDVFLDATNASGLVDPTGNIFNIHQALEGSVYAGDGDTDSVYRLRDLNHDGDANDAGEANVWFSAANAGGLPLVTPNGIAEGADGAIYVVNAGVSSTPEDAVYRTIDLNGDGDANDEGEASVWLDLKTLNASSSAFDISFIGDVAYVTDTNGGSPDTVYRIQDLNGDGDAADAGEASVFIADTEAYGAPIDIAHAAQGDSILTYTWIANDSDPSRIYRLTDLDGSGTIDSADEAVEVWNEDFLPEGFAPSNGFSIAADENGDVVFTANGGDPNEDNVVRLSDLNNDGDYMDAGETVIALSNFLDETIAVRPRAVAYYDDGTELPAGLTHETGGRETNFAEDLVVSDDDSALLSGATVEIVGGFGRGDLPDVDLARCSDISADYDKKTGVLTLSGEATAAEYQAVLQSLSFETRGSHPDEGLRNIEITVYDERGEAGASAAVATTIDVVDSSGSDGSGGHGHGQEYGHGGHGKGHGQGGYGDHRDGKFDFADHGRHRSGPDFDFGRGGSDVGRGHSGGEHGQGGDHDFGFSGQFDIELGSFSAHLSLEFGDFFA